MPLQRREFPWCHRIDRRKIGDDEGHAALRFGPVQLNVPPDRPQVDRRFGAEHVAPDPHQPDKRPVSRHVLRISRSPLPRRLVCQLSGDRLGILDVGEQGVQVLEEVGQGLAHLVQLLVAVGLIRLDQRVSLRNDRHREMVLKQRMQKSAPAVLNAETQLNMLPVDIVVVVRPPLGFRGRRPLAIATLCDISQLHRGGSQTRELGDDPPEVGRLL